jgi:hypothetical protein
LGYAPVQAGHKELLLRKRINEVLELRRQLETALVIETAVEHPTRRFDRLRFPILIAARHFPSTFGPLSATTDCVKQNQHFQENS